jgi:hypothetical protein
MVEAQTVLTEDDWKTLLKRIPNRCTPILGPETFRGTLPQRFKIAREWAEKFQYPFEDSDDLARVAQFVATTRDLDPVALRDEVLQLWRTVPPPNFEASNSVHGLLARIPVPIYITTAYDNYLAQALRANHRDARQAYCQWNRFIPKGGSAFENPDYEPTVANPVVFHLHGHGLVPESMVVTEDDYLDFLINTSRDAGAIPEYITAQITKASLLFVGYRLADIEFRVLIRIMASYLQGSMVKKHVSTQLIQVGQEVTAAGLAQAQQYLTKYFSGEPLNIILYSVPPEVFLTELKQRWDAFSRHGN